MLKILLTAHIRSLSQIIERSLGLVLSLILVLLVIASVDEFPDVFYNFKLS